MSPQLSLPAHLTNASTLVRMLDVGAVLKPASELLGQVNGLCGCGLVFVCVCVCVWACGCVWVCVCGWPGYPLVYSV